MFKSIQIIVLLATLALCDRKKAQDFVTKQNKLFKEGKAKWKAQLNPDINWDNPAEMKSRLGARLDIEKHPRFQHFDKNKPNDNAPRNLQTTTYPTTLDLRQKFSKCWSVKTIRNQGPCGTCWAVAGASTISDRWCIKNYASVTSITGFKQILFSEEDVIEACPPEICGGGSNSCFNGGWIDGAFQFSLKYGICTGANFGNNTFCKPYSVNPNIWPPVYNFTNSTTCNSAYTTAYSLDKKKLRSVTYVSAPTIQETEAAMIAALNLRGSLTVFILVYQDFYAYSSGVYQNNSTLPCYEDPRCDGGHAIKLIGYGVENGIKYWLAANTWGTGWGALGGTVKIERGTNTIQIEAFAVEGNF